MPTAAAQAPTLSDYNTMSIEQVYALDALTVPASLAGLPAISLPVGVGPADMPVAVQLIGPRLQVIAIDDDNPSLDAWVSGAQSSLCACGARFKSGWWGGGEKKIKSNKTNKTPGSSPGSVLVVMYI